MTVLVTYKNEEDPIRLNEGAGVFTHLSHCKSMEIFSNAQEQLTPPSMVEPRRISNSSEFS